MYGRGSREGRHQHHHRWYRSELGPFGNLGTEARVIVQVVMAIAILLCLAIAIWGAAKQRIGATALRDTFSAEQGKGLIVAGLTGVFIIGSLGTVFTIVYGMAV